MRFKYLHFAIGPIFGLTVVANSSAAPQVKDPQAIFDAMKKASGGSRWDAIGELDFTADISEGGLTGHRTFSEDLHAGRNRELYDLGGTSGGDGYDGHDGWFMDEKGIVSVRESEQARRETATESYIARNGWFGPSTTDPAIKRYLGEQHEAGRTYAVVRVTPRGGNSFDTWVDIDSHLLNRVIQQTDTGQTETTRYLDYKPVAGLLLPYTEQASDGNSQYDTLAHILKIATLAKADDKHFVMPSSSVHDTHIDGDATFAKVPFESYGGEILVDVSINGAKPMPFLLDSGGLNLLTPGTAQKLGVVGEGRQAVQGVGDTEQSMKSARVKSYRLGAVTLEDQRFLILDLPRILTDRGERAPIAGIIGYELLRRFVTRIDYDKKELTFVPNETFQYTGNGVRLPLQFDDRTPLVEASVDKVSGTFALDTGDMGDLTVFRPFAKAHDISLQGAIFNGRAKGVAGEAALTVGRLSSWSLGPYTLNNPTASLGASKIGEFASKVLAGNIGHGVLSKFVLTFDYAHRQIYVEKSKTFNVIERHGHSGINFDRQRHDRLIVTGVEPKSPAAASGLHVGDQVTAINGVPIARMGLDDIKKVTTQPAGAPIQLSVLRENIAREATLILID
ncbi:aspartyl protease family protein [Rhodanobacter sp. C03]|uniref:aspartyl protease family protein n=1 Tax=Rhodanobacter sp. C03 TaxID=1945858 RepID=UPI0014391315|nr:aspartyl protease family protein [Rhodanobacter sp. C03]